MSKLGSDSADFIYQQAWIAGGSVYKISGNRGTARFLNFTVQGPRPDQQPGTDWPSLHEPFGDIPEANLLGPQLATQWDGSFELYIGDRAAGPIGCPRRPARANSSCVRVLTGGQSCQHDCASSGSA